MTPAQIKPGPAHCHALSPTA